MKQMGTYRRSENSRGARVASGAHSAHIHSFNYNLIGGACIKHRNMRNSEELLVIKPEEKRPTGRPTPRWKDKFKVCDTLSGCRMRVCRLDSARSR
jgi:hypothetical protein